MKVALAIACIALLPGCAGTIEQSRERAPAATFSSSRPEPALEPCLAGKLAFMGSPSIIRGETSTEIAFSSDYGTELLVTISPAGSGSRIDLRAKHRNYLEHMSRAVESCV